MTQKEYLLGVGLILEKDEKILLYLRDNNPDIFFPNHWCIFTGGVDKDDWRGDFGDTLDSAVRREIEEELSVRRDGSVVPFIPESPKFFRKYKSTFSHNGQVYENIQFVYRAGLHVPVSNLRLNNEGQDLILAERSDIRRLRVAPNYRDTIEDFFKQ